MTQFEKWKRSARHRFKVAYKRTLKIEREKFQKQIDALKDQQAQALRDIRNAWARDVEQEREKAATIAMEIARVRLEVTPTSSFTTRFMMTTILDQHFMLNAQNLKEIGPYVVKMLVALITREFAQIDFTRLKPVVPDRPPGRNYVPTLRMDSHDDMRSW